MTALVTISVYKHTVIQVNCYSARSLHNVQWQDSSFKLPSISQSVSPLYWHNSTKHECCSDRDGWYSNLETAMSSLAWVFYLAIITLSSFQKEWCWWEWDGSVSVLWKFQIRRQRVILKNSNWFIMKEGNKTTIVRALAHYPG